MDIRDFFNKGAAGWKLDGTPAGLIDLYGNEKTLTVSSVSPYPSIKLNTGSSGYYFDNNAAKVITASGSGTVLTPDTFTLIAWFTKIGNTGATQVIAAKFRDAGGSYSYRFAVSNTVLYFQVTDSALAIASVTTTPPPFNKITCLIGTLDASSIMKFYINGKYIGKATLGTPPYIKTTNNFAIGRALNATLLAYSIIGQVALLPYDITARQAADYYEYETEPRRKYWLLGE